MPTYERADLSKVIPAVQCTARKQNGEPCRAKAARGANVCRVHGGSAPQVKAAAKRRLAQAADVLVQRLLAFALDGDTTDNVALQAIIAALDRAGLSVRQAIEIGVDPAPWEEVMTNITGIATISRDESRAQRGLPAPDTPALDPPHAMEIVEAELVPAQDGPTWAAQEPTDGLNGPDAPDVPPEPPQAATGALKGLVSFEEAVTETQTRTRVTRVRRLRQ